jgi:aspartate aminotransferase
MSISLAVQDAMKGSSWIRKMFEVGQALRERMGDDQVFDFSLGSPHLAPPPAFADALRELAANPPHGMHKYMPNNGFASTRRAIAERVAKREGVPLEADDIVMTVGAAGAINVALAATLDPGDEAIVLAPYFAEYIFYVRNHAGVVRIVETEEDFDLDLAAIEAAIGPRTKALILNTPNNPTGRIYSEEKLSELAELLARKERELGHTLYLLVDTPYAKIVYDGARNPLLFRHHPSSFIAHSFSKDMGLAGERIGYLAISPRAPHREALRKACTFLNRTLGYVNAPAIMQLALERALDASVDVDQYRQLRDRLCDGLLAVGYRFQRPLGAFYLFPRSPIPDDVVFTHELQKENVLVVPGSGFGRPGYLRIAFCVSMETVEGALPRFARAIERARAGTP